ncbi:O-antigen/teichoic acid export membrane protein [Elusimicrobium posterum]|uniref:lipopolysaccharide biosynthesis protein n=1 Tax=Elusimicrobium posterum TaxID=3116653 RepID=UPI003C748366
MGNNLFTIIKNTGIYFLGNVFSKLLAIILVPVYTRYISPSDYGYYDLTIVCISVFTMILFLNTGTAVLRFVIDKKWPKSKIFSSALFLFLISAAAYTLLFTASAYYFPFKYSYLIYLCGLLDSLVAIQLSILRSEGKNTVYVVSSIISSSVQCIFAILLLVVFKMDFSALFISMIAASALRLIIAENYTRFIRNFLVSEIDKKLLYSMLAFSIPLVLNGISYWFSSSYSKVVLVAKLGDAVNGLYATAGKFGMGISLAGAGFALAWQEMAYKKTSEKSDPAFFSKAFNFYLKVVFSIYILLIPIVNLMFPYLVAKDYMDAIDFVPLYMLWVLLDMITHFLGNIITGLKKTKEIFITTLAGAMLSVILLHVLIPLIGINGANLSLIAGFILTWILRLKILKQAISLKTDIKPVLVIMPLVIFVASGILTHDFRINISAFICLALFAFVYNLKEIRQVYTALEAKFKRVN